MGKFIVIVSLFILFLHVIPVNAQSTLALQEKCAEGAKKLIEDYKDVGAYTSHYNKKLDKCFTRVDFNLGQIEEDVKWAKGKKIKQPIWMISLVNVFQRNLIGECVYIGMETQECWVENTNCKTLDEFENLIRPYMEE